jgi:hypothetical protein
VAGSVRGVVSGEQVSRSLLGLPGVTEAVAEARAAVDGVLGHRALRRDGGRVAAEASLRNARASAALEGRSYPVDEVRGGTVTDPVVQGALRVAEALPGLVDAWGRAPRQVLARLHLLAARDEVPAEELGRPGASPLPAAEAAARLDALAGLVTGPGEAPAPVLAAVVHAELLAVRPFSGPNGVVARAAARLTLLGRGTDPRALIMVDAGHLAREPEYRGAAGAYATGTPDGVRSWLRHYSAALVAGAAETRATCDAILS